MLEFQHVPIKMQGIDTKSDDKDTIPGTYVVSENVFMEKTGKIQQRPGSRYPLSAVTHASEVIATAPYGNSTLALERDGDYYFNESAETTISTSGNGLQKNATIAFDTFITPTSVNSPYGSTSLNILGYSQSMGTSNGLVMWVVLTSGTTYTYYWAKLRTFSKVSEAEGSGQFTSSVFHAPICLGEYYAVFLASVNTLQIITVPTTTAIGYSVTTTGGNITRFDANENQSFIAIIHTSTAVTTTKLDLFNKSSTAVTSVVVSNAKSYNTVAVSINPNGTEIYVACCMSTGGANNIDVYVYDLALGLKYSYATNPTISGLNKTQLQIIEDTSDTTKLILMYTDEAASPYIEAIRIVKTTGVQSSTLGAIYNYVIASHVLYPYVILRNNADIFNCAYFLYDLSGTTGRLVSSFFYGQAVPYKTLYGAHELMHFNNVGLPMTRINPLSSINATNKLYSLLFSYSRYDKTANLPSMVNWNGSLITNAWGNLRILDNVTTNAAPLFASWPIASPVLTVVDVATAGSLVAGDYSYIAVYTAYDTNNNAIYSSPLYAVTHTVGPGITSVTVTATEQSGFVSPRGNVAIYRTELNGTVFYFLRNLSTNPFNDGLADTSLILNRVLYTTGDLIDSAPSPTAKFIAMAKSRLWLISPEEDNQVYFSKKTYPGEAPQFNQVYTLLVQNIGGTLQAVAEMDDKIVIFREGSIFVTYGEGPDELGNNSFAEPQVISATLGIKYPRSLILSDEGLFFMSYEGIYLLTHGLELVYIGAPVEDYNSLVITQALEGERLVYFYSASGTTLVYNSYFKIWHSYKNQATYAASILSNGTMYYYRTLAATKYPGRLMLEDASLFYDGAVDNPITITLESGWVSLAGVQGFQRMRTFTWIGNLNNTLTLKLYNDFEATENETFSILPATVGTTPAQYQVKPIRQRCQSMKYKITLASLTGNFDITSLGIEAGLKRGTVRYDRSKRVSS